MVKIVLLLAICLAAVAAYPNHSRIINGSLANISQYPFLAAILLSTNNVNFRHICGGTIINNRSILSAAHCFHSFATQQIRSRLGSTYASSGGSVYITSIIINHPNYNPASQRNDIGLVRVSSAISFGGNVRVGSIAGPNYMPGNNQVVWAAGWGLTATSGVGSELLRHVQIRVVSQQTCAGVYGSHLEPNMICAGGGGSGVCSGDSGGPLIHNNVVVGVVSTTALPCASVAAIFARVSSYSSWIQSNA